MTLTIFQVTVTVLIFLSWLVSMFFGRFGWAILFCICLGIWAMICTMIERRAR